MIRILLIRHAHTDLLGKVLYGRRPGIALSRQGRDEAMRLARGLLGQYQIDELLSSPLDRARETAEAIAEVHKQNVRFDERLQELDFGKWMGKTFSELASDEGWRAYNQHRSLSCSPCGELLTQVQARAWSALQDAVERNKNIPQPTIAAVTHGDVVRALLTLFLGMPLDYIHRLEISPASVSEIRLGSNCPRIVSLNRTL